MTKRSRDSRPAETGSSKTRPAGRGPLPDELVLWHHTARTITPLKRAKARVPEVGAETGASPTAKTARPNASSAKTEPRQAATKAHAPTPTARAALQKAPPPLVPIERRKARRIARGHVEIDARLDLHGLRQAEAERRLRTFLRRARAEGLRTVLVITGKGAERESADPHEVSDRGARGILRRSVPLWLEAPELRECVAGISPAHVRHGGSGALYIHIRKARDR